MTVAVGVCGFPRCGSSMLMGMLNAGGVPPVEGSGSASFELPGLGPEVWAGVQLAGRAVKLLDYSCRWPIPDQIGGWKFIWLDRSFREQARSMVKFMDAVTPGLLTGDAEGALRRSFKVDTPVALRELRRSGPILRLRFEDVLAHPLVAARDLARYLAPDFSLDVESAAAVVLERSGRCRPDLTIEMEAMKRG